MYVITYLLGTTAIDKELEDELHDRGFITSYSLNAGQPVAGNSALAGYYLLKLESGENVSIPDTFKVQELPTETRTYKTEIKRIPPPAMPLDEVKPSDICCGSDSQDRQ